MLFSLCIIWMVFCLYKTFIQDDDCFGGFLCGLMGCIICFILALPTEHEAFRTNHQKPIYSLKVSQELKGKFFLGTGQVNTDNLYYYYVKDERGGYIIDSSSIYGTFLFENDKKEPNISWQVIHYDVSRWVIPFPLTRVRDTKYDLTVPVGTIVKEYHGF